MENIFGPVPINSVNFEDSFIDENWPVSALFLQPEKGSSRSHSLDSLVFSHILVGVAAF